MTEKMDSKSHSLLIFISLSSLLLTSSFVEATCKPKYLTYPIPSSSSSSSSHSNHSSTSSSPPSPKQASTPSSSSSPPPPPKHSSSPPPPHTSSPPPPTPKSSPPPPTPTPSPPPPHTPTPSPPSKTQPADSISLISDTPTTSSPPKIVPPVTPSVTSVAGGINAAIKEICAKTDHADVCLSTIAPFIVPGKTDPLSVFGMQFQALNAHTETALDTATKLFTNPSTSSSVKSCIEDCKDVYLDAVDNLKSAADALASQDFPTVDSMLSAAMTDFGTCEDGFADFPELESPMTALDGLLHNMTSNLLALSSVCKEQYVV